MQRSSTQLAHQRVNPAMDVEPQLWPVWGWQCPLLSLRSSTARVRLQWSCFHWCETDAYVAAALCIKRNYETILCLGIVTDEMADCIGLLHCKTGCDANSQFYGKGLTSWRRALWRDGISRGEGIDLEEEVLEQLSWDMSSTATSCREVVENEEQLIHPSPSRCR